MGTGRVGLLARSSVRRRAQQGVSHVRVRHVGLPGLEGSDRAAVVDDGVPGDGQESRDSGTADDGGGVGVGAVDVGFAGEAGDGHAVGHVEAGNGRRVQSQDAAVARGRVGRLASDRAHGAPRQRLGGRTVQHLGEQALLGFGDDDLDRSRDAAKAAGRRRTVDGDGAVGGSLPPVGQGFAPDGRGHLGERPPGGDVELGGDGRRVGGSLDHALAVAPQSDVGDDRHAAHEHGQHEPGHDHDVAVAEADGTKHPGDCVPPARRAGVRRRHDRLLPRHGSFHQGMMA